MSMLDSVADWVPFMRPGHTARNAALAITALIALLFLPMTLILVALIVPVLLAFNVKGLRRRLGSSSLSHLPGLSHERRVVIALAAFIYLLVLAGAASAVWSGFAPAANNTTTSNGTPAVTANSTATPSSTPTTSPITATNQSNASSDGDTRQASPYPDQTLIKNISIVNRRDSDSDGRPEAFALRVRANTTLPAADGKDDAGEPYFAVAVGGSWKFDTPQIRRAANGSFTIPMNESRLSSASPGHVWVRVRMMDRNTIFHDRIATRKVRVRYAPASTPTPTATPTDTPTATSTPTPTATAVQDVAGEEDNDEDDNAAELYVAKKASEGSGDDRDYDTLTLEEEKERGWKAESASESRDPDQKKIYNESDKRQDKPESLGDDYDADELAPEKEDADDDGIPNGNDEDSAYSGDDSNSGSSGDGSVGDGDDGDFGGDGDIGDGNLFD